MRIMRVFRNMGLCGVMAVGLLFGAPAPAQELTTSDKTKVVVVCSQVAIDNHIAPGFERFGVALGQAAASVAYAPVFTWESRQMG